MPHETTKAVVLARGLGKRMRRSDPGAPLDPAQLDAAATGVKSMVPVGGRPFLDYVLSALGDAGYGDVCLVVGPEHEAVRRYLAGDARPQRVRVSFAVQAKPLGTADAVLAAQAFAGDERFAVVNGDNYYPVEALAALRRQPGAAVAAFSRRSLVELGNLSVERTASFPVLEADPQGLLTRLLEPADKRVPEPREDALVSMNCWLFGPAIFGACRAITPARSGELELPEAVRYMVSRLGERMRVLPFRLPVLDLTARADVAGVAARLAAAQVRL